MVKISDLLNKNRPFYKGHRPEFQVAARPISNIDAGFLQLAEYIWLGPTGEAATEPERPTARLG